MAKQLNLIYAISESGSIVHISEVTSGLSCNCVCPACGSRLIAKKGKRKAKHFAHEASSNCEYGYETSLHMAAKEILLSAQTMMIPEVVVQFNGLKRIQLISREKEIKIDRVELEPKIGNIIPDIVVYSGNRKLLIEIFVTHKIDRTKLEKIKELDISTIEIDLSKCAEGITEKSLREILIENNENKYWVYNSIANKKIKKWHELSNKRTIEEIYEPTIGSDCPLRIAYGEYGSILINCNGCIYCLEINREKKYVICAGENLISEFSDVDLSIEQKKEKEKLWIENRAIEQMKNCACPYCNWGVITKKDVESGISFECDMCNRLIICNKEISKIERTTFVRKRKL